MTEQAGSTLGTFILQNGLALGEMYEPSTPGATAEEKDTSAQNNIGGIKTSLVTWIKHDNLGFKILYTGSTAHETLAAGIYTRALDTWQVVLPPTFRGGGHSFSWVGQIASCKKVIDGDGPAYLEMEVTVSGRVTPLTTLGAGLTGAFFTTAPIPAAFPPADLTPSPAAAGDVYEYDVETYSNSTGVTITPIAAAGTIYVDGKVVASGSASDTIALNTGLGSITYVSIVVTQLNKTPVIYWLRYKIGPTATPV